MALAPLAEPPESSARDLPIVEEERPWFRVHDCALGAVYFNRSANYRFNAPAGEFGVLYVAEAVDAAFSETFIRIGKRPPVVQQGMLAQRTVSELRWTRALKLVDFTGPGLVRLGVDARLSSHDDCALCQRWALWIHEHPARADGLLYRARTAPHRRSLALFERAGVPEGCKALVPSLASVEFSAQLGEILNAFGAELV